MTVENYTDLGDFAKKYKLEFHGIESSKNMYLGYYRFSTYCTVDVDYSYDGKSFVPDQKDVLMFIWIDQNKEFNDRLSPKRVYMEFSTHPADRVRVNLNWIDTLRYSVEDAKSTVRKKVRAFIESWNIIKKEK